MKVTTAFYEGVVSSFFIQTSTCEFKTSHRLNDATKIGSNLEDWQKVGEDFKRATDKFLFELEPSQRHSLEEVRYQYVTKTT